MSLPELVVFSAREANNGVRYLSFFGPHRLLRFRLEEGVYSDTVKFAVEPAGDGLVHIRSCYENYYWASGKASKLEPWLVASAPEKVVDISKDECTLFRPLISPENGLVGFVHVQSGLNVVMRPDGDMRAYKLYLDQAAPTHFSYIDLAPLSRTKLPRYVMFTSDNNKYLSTKKDTEKPGYVHLAEYNDIPTSREVGFEVLYNHSGDLRIKSMSTNEFLLVLPTDTRVVTNTLPEFHLSTLFDAALSSPPNARVDGIALRSHVYNKFLSIEHDHLVAESNTPHVFNSLLLPKQLATAGQSRVNIKNFRHAWAGPKSFRNVRKMNITNTNLTGFERDIPTQYQKFTKLTFSHSFPLVQGSTALFNARIPKVNSTGELEFPDVATDVTTSWGNTKSVALIEKEYARLVLPPSSKVVATLSINIATYVLPFSYQQIDEFEIGGTETQYLNDGVLKIESEYGVEFRYDIQPLTSEEFDDGNIETDLQVLEREGINAIEDGIEPNACIACG